MQGFSNIRFYDDAAEIGNSADRQRKIGRKQTVFNGRVDWKEEQQTI